MTENTRLLLFKKQCQLAKQLNDIALLERFVTVSHMAENSTEEFIRSEHVALQNEVLERMQHKPFGSGATRRPDFEHLNLQEKLQKSFSDVSDIYARVGRQGGIFTATDRIQLEQTNHVIQKLQQQLEVWEESK